MHELFDPDLFNYQMVVLIMMTGLYIIITHGNLIKKLIGLGIFQAAIFILFITLGKVSGGTAPILSPGHTIYSSPLPHVLILTAIVVGIATTALGLALALRIHQLCGTVEEDAVRDRMYRE